RPRSPARDLRCPEAPRSGPAAPQPLARSPLSLRFSRRAFERGNQLVEVAVLRLDLFGSLDQSLDLGKFATLENVLDGDAIKNAARIEKLPGLLESKRVRRYLHHASSP